MFYRYNRSEVSIMSVRILVGENEDVRELANEFPQEASIIEEMLKAAEADSETEAETEEEDESVSA
jgi:hypothetical protein